jgi:hypothetical protein
MIASTAAAAAAVAAEAAALYAIFLTRAALDLALLVIARCVFCTRVLLGIGILRT